jgi:hypothetical protein
VVALDEAIPSGSAAGKGGDGSGDCSHNDSSVAEWRAPPVVLAGEMAGLWPDPAPKVADPSLALVMPPPP